MCISAKHQVSWNEGNIIFLNFKTKCVNNLCYILFIPWSLGAFLEHPHWQCGVGVRNFCFFINFFLTFSFGFKKKNRWTNRGTPPRITITYRIHPEEAQREKFIKCDLFLSRHVCELWLKSANANALRLCRVAFSLTLSFGLL